jgi:hypothetical protein
VEDAKVAYRNCGSGDVSGDSVDSVDSVDSSDSADNGDNGYVRPAQTSNNAAECYNIITTL